MRQLTPGSVAPGVWGSRMPISSQSCAIQRVSSRSPSLSQRARVLRRGGAEVERLQKTFARGHG